MEEKKKELKKYDIDDMRASMKEGVGYEAMFNYDKWRTEQRKRDKKELQKLKFKIFMFKNPERIKEYGRKSSKKYYKKMREDPKLYNKHLEHCRKYQRKMMLDPIKYEERLKKSREYYHKHKKLKKGGQNGLL